MLKVVIADNEARFCRLVQMLADWNALGMEVIGTASNGFEALELVETLMPYILITDIRMPGCDPEVWRDQNVREGVRREYAAILGGDVFDKRVDALSEIQKYKLVYTRIAIQKPKVVFCVQPFRRADMELRMHIWG